MIPALSYRFDSNQCHKSLLFSSEPEAQPWPTNDPLTDILVHDSLSDDLGFLIFIISRYQNIGNYLYHTVFL